MATTWAGTANNQAITRAALQDAINTGIVNWRETFIPTSDSTKCVNYLDAFFNYTVINTIAGTSNNQLIVKSEVTSSNTNGVGIGGRRDGSNVTVRTAFSGSGTSITTLNSSTCTLYGSNAAAGTGSVTITVRSGSNQDIKFWLTEGGTTCPSGGTEYSSFTYTRTSNRNFLIVPVWNGTSYTLV